ncbi:MAG: hypothetical protein IJF49_08080 [Clostridia bacterium]|nr:hypothetical protein [Clostridia bacterium]
MGRIHRSIIVDDAILTQLKQELDEHKHLLDVTPDTLTPDHLLFIRSLTPLINWIDPRFNGGDDSLAQKWYSAEDADSDFTEFGLRLQIIRALLRFQYAKIADVGRGKNPDNPIPATYTLSRAEERILTLLHEELPALTQIRRTGNITEAHCTEIMEFYPLIDAIDRKYAGVNHSPLPQGLSLAERWYQAQYLDFDSVLPRSPEEFAVIFERFYTILYTLAKHGFAVTVHSVDGHRSYPEPIYSDQT